ncbi:MAG: hypothetical protein M3Y77_11870 [Actinomycetota bacterium]|nr:hypothetical protein [Actinomycetota bacterium]MDQ2847023.1 hypothetical protein [Actinomycetota bacterium]
MHNLLAIASTNGAGKTHGPVWLFYVFAVIFLIFGIALIINPKLQWKMSRWQFKNPAASEPSAKGLVMIRVGASVFVVIAVVILIVGINHS